jgi:predicted nucleic acid-binding protein
MSAGLLDTSVVIDWDEPNVAAALPEESSVCAITLAELAAGPHLASTATEGARRQARLQQADMLIAATAHANGLPLYTRNPDDFAGLEDLLPIIGL